MTKIEEEMINSAKEQFKQDLAETPNVDQDALQKAMARIVDVLNEKDNHLGQVLYLSPNLIQMLPQGTKPGVHYDINAVEIYPLKGTENIIMWGERPYSHHKDEG